MWYRNKKEVFFIPVPFAKFSSSNTPFLDVNIQGKVISLKLDLGFSGYLSLSNRFTDLFDQKIPTTQRDVFGIRGKPHPCDEYHLDNIKIDRVTFSNLVLQKEIDELVKESCFSKNSDPSIFEKDGKLGWKIFRNSNLLIDINNAQVAFCDSFTTLQSKGYFNRDYAKIPLLLDRGLVEINTKSSIGFLRCVLDTGSTINILNGKLDQGENIEEAIWNANNIIESPFFKVDEYDLGVIEFARLPICLPIPIDAVLGIEFFKNHLVFLDFLNGFAYISNIKT